MDERLILIGELAKRSGVTARALRDYERRGLIAPIERGTNKYRLFDPGIEPTIILFGSMLSLGLSLHEVTEVFADVKPVRHAPSAAETRLTMARAKVAYEHHTAQIQEEVDRLDRIKTALAKRIENCRRELAHSGPISLDGLRQARRQSRPGRVEYVREGLV